MTARANDVLRKKKELIRLEYEKNPKCCIECNRSLKFEHRLRGKYCSRRCSVKFANKGKFWAVPKICRRCPNAVKNGVICDQCRAKLLESRSPEAKLIANGPTGAPREALMKIREYRCEGEGCTVISTWLGKNLTLHFDHINGDRNDHRRENARWLCPNCHSQTPTYAGRNMKRKSQSEIV